MKISVVMCTYNGAQFLEQQLDSLRMQTLALHEVIICDDGSNDGTANLVRSYMERYSLENWHFYENAQNKGYRRNFHDAAAMATGDWVAFCDQDDIWHADKLERLKKVAEQNPEARLVAASFDIIDAKGTPIPHEAPRGQSNHGMIHRELAPGAVYRFSRNAKNTAMLLSGNIALGCTMMVHRDILRDYVQYSRMELPHDWEAVLWAFLKDGLFFLNAPVIDYRLHGKNTIGLPIGAEATRKATPSLAGRLDVMDHYDESIRNVNYLIQKIGCTELDEAYPAYGKLRREMLEKRSLVCWIKLHRYYRIYANMFTLRQRLGDLWVTLRK